MTTPAAEKLYQAQHLVEQEGKRVFIFNPKNQQVQDLPAIYAFSNAVGGGDGGAYAIAQDGVCLGSHLCSNEIYVPYDLGVLENTREDRHEYYKKHYPEGFRMVFVRACEVKNHSGLTEALNLNSKLAEKEEVQP